MEEKIIRNGDGEFLIEGEELTQFYFKTGKIVFAINTLPAGQTASLDKGHKNSHEVGYVIQGSLKIHFPEKDKYYNLNIGDAILIPEDKPHYLINVGKDMSIVAFACAPKL